MKNFINFYPSRRRLPFALFALTFMLVSARNVAALTSSASAAASANATEMSLPRREVSNPSRLSIGAIIQAHSVSNTSSPWFGISASYKIFHRVSLGLRGFVPMSQPVDKSTYAAQAFSRISCVEVRQNDFYVEPDYALNFYDFVPFQSIGGAVGVLDRVSPGLSIGAAGGVELSKTILDSIGLERVSNYRVYPKVALLTNFYF